MRTLVLLLVCAVLPISVSVGCIGATTDNDTVRLPDSDHGNFRAYLTVTRDSIFSFECDAEQCDTIWRAAKAPTKIQIWLTEEQWQKLLKILDD